MHELINFWRMLAGVALFLMAMAVMESSLRAVAGRAFKLFLKKHTANPLKSIGGGALVSAILQSSSIVNLLVLGMVGSGIVAMQHALALMLGSNLGTTFTGWLLASLGFKIDIEGLFLPLTAVCGIAMALVNEENKWLPWIRWGFSIGLLFVSLSFMRTGMEGFLPAMNMAALRGYPSVLFIISGLVITALIQSSSAMIAITLTALHSQAITLQAAMAIALGAEIGTTLKLFLASARGIPEKKRVALGNFLVNLVTAAIIWPLINPLKSLLDRIFTPDDAIFSLALFQTLINISSIILFLPFLKPFGSFLLKRFRNDEDELHVIQQVPLTNTEMALDTLAKQTRSFIRHVADYSLDSFSVSDKLAEPIKVHEKYGREGIAGKYLYLKHFHGELHRFSIRLQNTSTSGSESERLSQLISSIRNSMYAAKNIHDAQSDISQVSRSSNETKYQFFLQSREIMLSFYTEVLSLVPKYENVAPADKLVALHQSVTKGYTGRIEQLYRAGLAEKVNEEEISTLINFNREIYTSLKSMVISIKDLLLNPADAEYFDSLPGFIH